MFVIFSVLNSSVNEIEINSGIEKAFSREVTLIISTYTNNSYMPTSGKGKYSITLFIDL